MGWHVGQRDQGPLDLSVLSSHNVDIHRPLDSQSHDLSVPWRLQISWDIPLKAYNRTSCQGMSQDIWGRTETEGLAVKGMSWDVTGQRAQGKGMSQDIWGCHGMSQDREIKGLAVKVMSRNIWGCHGMSQDREIKGLAVKVMSRDIWGMSQDREIKGLAVKEMSQDIWGCHGMSQPGQRDHGASCRWMFWDVSGTITGHYRMAGYNQTCSTLYGNPGQLCEMVQPHYSVCLSHDSFCSVVWHYILLFCFFW